MAKAQMLLEMAEKGLVDKAEAVTRILNAASIDDVESLIPQPDPMAEVMQEAQMFALQLELQLKSAEIENKMAETQASLAKAAKDVASAESEELGRNMTVYMNQLKAMKESLNVRREQFAGMAGPPGNGAPVSPVAAPTGPLQGASGGGILGG
jgi:ABC-type phosphate transport system auxiliary subunit